MSELLEDSAGKFLANVATEIFKSIYQGTANAVSAKNKEIDVLNLAARRYTKNIHDRYNIIRIFGMSKPVPLKDLYVKVNVLEKISHRIAVELEEMESQIGYDNRFFGIEQKTIGATVLVNRYPYIIVLGKPGAGKTTFLKYLALMQIKGAGSLEKKRLPIFVTLKDFADSNKSLLEFIATQFDIYGVPEADKLLERLLKRGKCQILLDGLDEVEKKKIDMTIKEIIDISDKYDKNQFIISCRIAAYNHWFERYIDVEIADFKDEQSEKFVNNWFREEPQIGIECWTKIKVSPQLKELASTPLLLTLLCIAYDDAFAFPSNRAELYEEAIEALLKKWDSTRRIRRGEIYKLLSYKRKKFMFSKIAAQSFERGEHFFKTKTLEKCIEEYIQHLPGINETKVELDSKAILKAIEAQHGIFVTRAKGIHSFSHLTFQEYFTARYIVDNKERGTLPKLIEHVGDDRWREVLLLTAGMLNEADEFILLIEEQISQLVKNDEVITKLIMGIHEIPSRKEFKKPALLALYIYFVLSSVRLESSLKVLIRARGLALELVHLIDKDLSKIIHVAIYNNPISNLKKALILEAENEHVKLITNELEGTFSEDSINKIAKYLYWNQLMATCIMSEIYLSKETREKVMNRFFI